MKKVELENGAYKLVADEGKRLVITDADGNESYTQEVLVPSGVTLNEWGEAEAVATAVATAEPTEEEIKKQRIAQLEAALAELKSEQG